MKKVYQNQKWIDYSLRRACKELKRKQRKRKELKRQNKTTNIKTLINYPIEKKNKQIRIKAPENFSLINNAEETLNFFTAVNSLIKEKENIFFDLSTIGDITTDAILYILSSIEYSRKKYHDVHISGNEPSDNKCKEILRSSGFFRYVYSTGEPKLKSDPNVYSIKSNSMVEPIIAAEVKKFAMNNLSRKESTDTKSIYTTIIECMTNTKQHAYKKESLNSKWWIMASLDQNSKRIHFTFLDNGLGIPVTIRKGFRETVDLLLHGGKYTGQAGFLIDSALKGEFRTRTKTAHRGKGLPMIEKYFKEGKINDLIIISKKGYENKESNKVIDLENSFHGTLLSWDFV
jgi:anti-sigma regulatory factor (Ser/Thr protein kinase)